MNDSARYVKVVEWSEADQCYVGSAPGLVYGGCHGDDERLVFEELCRIVEEAVALYRVDGRLLPPATSGREFGSYFRNFPLGLPESASQFVEDSAAAWPNNASTPDLFRLPSKS